MTRLILGLMINLHLRGPVAALHALEAAQTEGFGQSSARVSSISDWRMNLRILGATDNMSISS